MTKEELNNLASLMAVELGHLIIEVRKGSQHKGCCADIVQNLTGLVKEDAETIVRMAWEVPVPPPSPGHEPTENEHLAYRLGVEDGMAQAADLLQAKFVELGVTWAAEPKPEPDLPLNDNLLRLVGDIKKVSN